MEDSNDKKYSSIRSYTIGFVLSLALTVEAFLVISGRHFSTGSAITIVLALAIVQLLVQLFFFLHLDRLAKAPWNIIILLFTGLVVAIVVYGSLWIMSNLNYHMMTPSQTEQYMRSHEGL